MSRNFALAIVLFVFFAAASAQAQTFTDVPQNHWAADAVEKAARLGLVVGRGDGTVKGDAPPTRYEMAMGLSKVLAEVENRMKAQPVFTRDVLEALHGLNTQLAKTIDNIQVQQRYEMFLLQNHYRVEHNREMPDLRAQFNQSVGNKLNSSD